VNARAHRRPHPCGANVPDPWSAFLELIGQPQRAGAWPMGAPSPTRPSEIVRAQLREHRASTKATRARWIAFNTDRPLEAMLEELRRELDGMLVLHRAVAQLGGLGQVVAGQRLGLARG
jgi:hypothetical protein